MRVSVGDLITPAGRAYDDGYAAGVLYQVGLGIAALVCIGDVFLVKSVLSWDEVEVVGPGGKILVAQTKYFKKCSTCPQ